MRSFLSNPANRIWIYNILRAIMAALTGYGVVKLADNGELILFVIGTVLSFGGLTVARAKVPDAVDNPVDNPVDC
jgi:hypothetical protein